MSAPVIYNAHPITGELLGTGSADPDPMDADNWLVPANSYLESPPTPPSGKVVMRSADGWAIVNDHRGTVYSKEDGTPSVYSALGELPENLTSTPRPDEYHKWKNGRWELDRSAETEGLSTQAITLRDQHLQAATLRMAPLQDAVDENVATDAEKDLLSAWKRYRIALNRLEQQMGFPHNIVWPESPGQI